MRGSDGSNGRIIMTDYKIFGGKVKFFTSDLGNEQNETSIIFSMELHG